MGASPSTMNFEYQINEALPALKSTNITPTDNSDYFMEGPWISSKPSWLNVSKVSQREKPAVAKYNVSLIKSKADNLNEGLHSGTIVFGMKRLSGRLDSVTVSVTLEITDPPPPPNPEKVTYSFSANGDNPCGLINVNYTVKGGVAPYKLYKNGVLSASGLGSTFTNPLNRNGQQVQIEIKDTNNNPISVNGDIDPNSKFNVVGVRRLNSNDVNISIGNYSSGSTVSVSVTFLNSLVTPYEYSLDGVNWQSESVFSGLLPDTYTLRIRDKLGCVYTEDFTTDDVVVEKPTVAYISQANPIRYAIVNSAKKNYFNTLSFLENRQQNYTFKQKWIETDIITTQFKTNAEYINIYAVDCHGEKTELVPTRVADNTDLIGYSTATMFSSPNNIASLYYGKVDLLDPTTEEITDSVDYVSTLPNWITEGQEVEISGLGFSKVTRIYFSETYQSLVAELDFSYSGSENERNVKAIYDIHAYDVYEFMIHMTVMPNDFQVVIELGDSFDDIKYTYISEIQSKFKDNDRYVEIQYYNDVNVSGMNYDTGIKHLIRVEAYQNYVGEHSVEGYNGYEKFYATRIELFNSENVIFPRLTTAMAHKLRIILSHKNLLINNVPCTIAEGTEISGMPSTNFKKLTCLVKLTGEEFIKGQYDDLAPVTDGGFAGIEIRKDLGLLLWTYNA